MIASASYCQPTDTIHVNRQQFVRMLTKAEQAKALEAQRDLLLNGIDTLKARITIKEMMIANLNGQVGDYKNIIASNESIIATMKEQRSIFEAQVKDLNKQIRKQRNGKRWTAVVGILATAASLILYITK
jgi:chromosome segregation ATPase